MSNISGNPSILSSNNNIVISSLSNTSTLFTQTLCNAGTIITSNLNIQNQGVGILQVGQNASYPLINTSMQLINSNAFFEIASAAGPGSFSTSAIQQDIVMRSSGGGRIHLQTGGGSAGVTISNNYIGINNPSPTNQLDVIGTVNFSSNLTVNGCIQALNTGALLGRVYDDTCTGGTYLARFSGRPYLTSLVQSFNWPSTNPIINNTNQYVSVRFIGYISVNTTDTYTFAIGVDDNFTLYINHTLVSSFTGTGPFVSNQYTGSISLTANVYYPFLAEFTNYMGGAGFQINWKNTTTQTSYVNLAHGTSGVSFAYDNLESSPNQLGTLYVSGNYQSPSHQLLTGGYAARVDNVSTWSTWSDARLKSNIVPIVDGLEKITQLMPISYEWIRPQAHGGKKNGVSFIAQEFSAVFPSCVHSSQPTQLEADLIPDGQCLSINQDIVPHLVASIKELNSEVKELKRQIKLLENILE
jgi:hypothetical protein